VCHPPPPDELSARRPRVALYSHDAMGIGHMRRNLLIAQTLVASSLRANVLLVAGAAEANVFAARNGVDCLTLPAVHKEANGSYRSRSLALEAFEPDVLIVDKLPRGLGNELDPTLEHFRQLGDVSCVLGLRDVLDEPMAVQRDWERVGNEAAVERYYDAVWVYGDPGVYDVIRECRFSERVAKKALYTGYLDRRAASSSAAEGQQERSLADSGLPSGPFVLCMVGGGQDGDRLASTFADARLPENHYGVIVTGPFMSPAMRASLRRRAGRDPRLRVLEFVSEPTALLGRAERVIAMGGYNTVSEVLSFQKLALIVPRVEPRREQLIRAKTMQRMGLVHACHPQMLRPETLTDWLATDLEKPRRVREQVDLDGLSRLPGLLEQLLRSHPIPPSPRTS
jgi:predicted glycosyltransferase